MYIPECTQQPCRPLGRVPYLGCASPSGRSLWCDPNLSQLYIPDIFCLHGWSPRGPTGLSRSREDSFLFSSSDFSGVLAIEDERQRVILQYLNM